MSYLINKDILSDKMSIERKIWWLEGCYVYMGISKEIEEFEENTERLNKEKRNLALNVLEELVKYYGKKYIVSGKFLEDKFIELKKKVGGR